jgi:hypothetical protein
MGEMKNATSLKDIFKFYCSSHPELKKFWKKKTKDLASQFNLEAVNKKKEETEDEESEEEVKPKAKAKSDDTKKATPKVEEKNSKLLNKKTVRKDSSDSDESESEEEIKKPLPKKEKKSNESNGIANNAPTPIKNGIKTPFKRIDDSLKEILPVSLQDNSYEKFMNSTGENYGHAANEKLKITKGKGFKKEKTKFKNKTAFGGLNISTEVRSIPLDTDSD